MVADNEPTVGSPLRKSSSDNRAETVAVAIMAVVTALLFLRVAFLEPRRGGIDEISLSNPPYVRVNWGKLAYPAHTYPEGMFVHPPIHTGLVATLMRLGLPLSIAEVLPGLGLLFVCLFAIVRGPFGFPLQAGLLAGLLTPIALFGANDWFGMRPDLQVFAAWMAGLLLLEWGRLRDWNPRTLALGSFLLTYAAGTHYYAVAACLGVAVYLGWAIRRLPRDRARRVAVALVSGGLLFGVPYVLLFVVPSWRGIQYVLSASEALRGIGSALEAHQAAYRYLVDVMATRDKAWLLEPFAAGLPLLPIAAALLLWLPATRGFALAALPLTVFVWLIAGHKPATYLVHEVALLVIGAVSVVLGSLGGLVAGWRARVPRWLVSVSLAALIVGYLGGVPGELRALEARRIPGFSEMDLARAAGRSILGPDARVGYRSSFWYVGGEAHWYMIDQDIHWRKRIVVDLRRYLPIFDAVAVNRHFSDYTTNAERVTTSALYARGDLQLRGFFWAQDDYEVGYLLVSARRPARIVGFARTGDRLYRFVEGDSGPYELVSADCRADATEARLREAAPWSHYLLLPAPPTTPEEGRHLASVIRETAGAPGLPESCRAVLRTTGVMTEVDPQVLVGQLKRGDQPIRFYSSLYEFAGPERAALAKRVYGSPPADAIRLGRAFQLDQATAASRYARVERGAAPVVHMPVKLGRFGLSVPLTEAGPVLGPCWIEARLHVTSGKVLLAALERGSRDVMMQSAPFASSQMPQEVFLTVPSCRSFAELVTRVADPISPSTVRVERLSLWVRGSDWENQRHRLALLQ